MTDPNHTCPRCREGISLRLRQFSDQAMTALLVWQELSPNDMGKPICEPCYDELREVLIDRASELEEAAKQPIPPHEDHSKVTTASKKPAAKPAPKIKTEATRSAPAKKVAKAKPAKSKAKTKKKLKRAG